MVDSVSFGDYPSAPNLGPRNSIDSQPQSNDPRSEVSASIKLSGGPLEDVTVKEVIVGESLLNPSVHTAITLQSAMYFSPQNWDLYRCQPVELFISDNNDQQSATNPRNMTIKQHVYRCDNRRFSSTNTGQTEDLTLHSIDETILNDAQTIFEKSWKCATPGQVVKEALQQIDAQGSIVADNTGPGRPYVAESIHPLQVIQQQANVALANGDDPSFVHYMTIQEQTGKNVHNFRSLYDLMHTSRTPYEIFAADTAVSGYNSFSDSFASLAMRTAITFNFPCDYDVLSDVLNGISCGGKYINQVRTTNFLTGDFQGVNAGGGSGIMDQIGNIAKTITNFGSSQQQNSCETHVEKFLLKRQARMGLLERDKIALRITIPWSPWLHVGNQINFNWTNRYDPSKKQYGHGKYLIVHLTHNIQYGGYAVTTLDCIANTFGNEAE